MTRAVVLVDGEHYPPVTRQGIDALRARGFDVVAAVFAGGGEKLSRRLDLDPLPIVADGDPFTALDDAIERHEPEVVLELSDDPVVTHAVRMRFAAVALSRGVAYEAPGFRMTPPPRSVRVAVPSIAVIGTGKRCGKTAVCAHVARTLCDAGMRPGIVAMGRGGPEQPVVVLEPPDAARLLAIADAGEHAASDVYEDAVIAGVPVAGARRAGAGPSGETSFDTVAAAAEALAGAGCDVLLFEGSGTAIPPVATDATLLVARSEDEPGNWPLAHRILLADLVVVRMPDEQVGPAWSRNTPLASPNRERPPVVSVTLHPTPTEPINGRKVFVVTTAPQAAGDAIRASLEGTHGAHVVGLSHNLSDRALLAEEMDAAVGRYDVVVFELKAAAVDVAVRRALAAGAEATVLDNRPRSAGGDLEDRIVDVARTARERFARR